MVDHSWLKEAEAGTARQSPHGIGLVVITDDTHRAFQVAERKALGHFRLPLENPDHYVERLKNDVPCSRVGRPLWDWAIHIASQPLLGA